ncbi:MAG: hypothetical protein O7G88_08160 [bacterium]|nr:hypothetical protein [bacterium]
MLQKVAFRFEIGLLFLAVMIAFSVIHVRATDGPLGLHWGMPKAEVEALGIGLSKRQVGKWGARYLVSHEDFNNLPNALGDEEKVYLYFGNTDKLLRIYIAIKKVDGWNRYRQVNALAEKKYSRSTSCARQKYDKYEALTKGKSAKSCEQYDAYSTYERDSVEVFVGLEKLTINYRVSLIFLHGSLYRADQGKKNPL